jgi:branched-chain amino acid aminotransferase
MGQGFACINGIYSATTAAQISVLDPGFTRSDAVYDVISVWKGLFFRLEEHIERFFASCRGVQIICPLTPMEIRRILATCVIQGDVSEAAYVAIVATRGSYMDSAAERERDIFRTRPTIIAYAIPYVWIADMETQQRGLRLIVARTPRIPDVCVNTKYKNYHWGDLTRGKFEAKEAGADAAVHLSIEGFLTEGAGFNLFLVRNQRLYTPARNVLSGVTRAATLDLAAELGISAETGDYTAEDLRTADEAFLTSTAGGIMPIAVLNGKPFRQDGQPGPLSVLLRDQYWQRREQGWHGTRVEDVLSQ